MNIFCKNRNDALRGWIDDLTAKNFGNFVFSEQVNDKVNFTSVTMIMFPLAS